mmetsp:Transcript_50686/g.107528  ORF Transcript_50686/g.107528 Transcript_50686/m.107528 type:complete len:310 (-) Transcript_50686:1830-2759(-)
MHCDVGVVASGSVLFLHKVALWEECQFHLRSVAPVDDDISILGRCCQQDVGPMQPLLPEADASNRRLRVLQLLNRTEVCVGIVRLSSHLGIPFEGGFEHAHLVLSSEPVLHGVQEGAALAGARVARRVVSGSSGRRCRGRDFSRLIIASVHDHLHSVQQRAALHCESGVAHGRVLGSSDIHLDGLALLVRTPAIAEDHDAGACLLDLARELQNVLERLLGRHVVDQEYPGGSGKPFGDQTLGACVSRAVQNLEDFPTHLDLVMRHEARFLLQEFFHGRSVRSLALHQIFQESCLANAGETNQLDVDIAC